jgi:hypothetical protein
MSAKAIVTKLRTLAADPANRAYIVKGDQGCLPGLVVFLEEQDQDVVLLALEVIYFLSLETANRELMAREPGLLKMLRKLASNGKLKQKKLAIAAYTNLQAYTDKIASEEDNAVSAGENQQQISSPSSLSDGTTPRDCCAATNTCSRPTSKGGVNCIDTARPTLASAHTYTLFIAELKDEKTKKIISDCLLSIKGVISFIIDLIEQKVVVRSVISIEAIVQAIFANTGMRASTKDRSKFHSTDCLQEDNKENYPDYLPEVKRNTGQQQNSNNRGWFGLGAIISLSDAKKEQKQKEASTLGWFSKLGKALNII